MEKQEIKKLFANNLLETSKLPIEEHILHEKWMELNNTSYTSKDLQSIYEVKQQIWIPTNADSYMDLEPEVILADSKVNSQIWTTLRRFTSTAKWSQSPGRFAKFLIKDKKTQTYLGVISIGSDFISIGGRDKHIGWNTKHKMDNHRLNYLCMGSSIVPTQPLGYNFTGGKLIALLTVSDVVEDWWNNKYKEKLVGVTTTSLYGNKGISQYTGLHAWHQCEFSKGNVTLEPSEKIYVLLKEWVKEKFPKKYEELMTSKKSGPVSHVRPRLLSIAHKELGVKAVNNQFSRGVYFCELYDNTKEFLCCKTDILGNKKFDNSVKTLSDIWKQRYARKRINKLVKENKNNNDILFYDSLIDMTWEEAKNQFLVNVGR